MTLRIEGQPNWKVTPPRRRRGAPAGTTGGEVLPTFLQDGTFEVVEEVLLQGPALQPTTAARRGTRRGAEGAAATLTVTLDQPAGEPYVVVARQESGAISFHIPEPAEAPPVRGGRRGAKRAAALTVTIPVGIEPAAPQPSAAKRRPTTRGGLVNRVVKVVVVKVAQAVADYAIEKLGRLLEEKLWRDAQREEGWVRVQLGDAAAVSCVPEVPTDGTQGRALLLLHGTFSHVEAAFQGLLGDPATAARIKALYGDRIYGYQHFTISKTPQENVAELLAPLPKSLGLTCDVITHSRGGLVLRTLHRELTKGRRPNTRLTLGRVMLVASPNEGTPLATPQRWEQTLGWFANLLEMFPDNPFTTAAGWISGSLSWLAQGLNNNLPGIQAMNANGETIQQLSQIPLTSKDEWYGLVVDTRVPAKTGLAARLADLGVDAFFDGPNDLVVPTEGGYTWGGSPPVVIPAARVGRFGPKGNLSAPADALVMHTTLFGQADTHRFLADSLQWPVVAGTTMSAAVRAGLPKPQLPSLLPGVQPSSPPTVVLPNLGETTVLSPREATPVSHVTTGLAVQPVEFIRTEADDKEWSRQDALVMIVLDTSPHRDDASHAETAETETGEAKAKKAKPKKEAQLLAMYGGASVVVPFRLGGDEEGAGKRWQKIIARQISVTRYMNTGTKEPPTPEQMEELGTLLFDTMFPPPVRLLYDQARYRERSRKLNVVFTSMVPWVADLPWEFAFDNTSREYVAVTDVRFVRGVLTGLASDRIEMRVASPLRILLVAAQPGDLAQLDLSQEIQRIREVLSKLEAKQLVSIEVLPNATAESLHAAVRRARYGEIDVVHFMGHGDFDESEQTGYLLFDNGQGATHKVSTEYLCAILRSRGIKVVFLNACQTGQGGFTNYNKGVAPGLVAGGIPAVVANQYSVFDNAATRFARVFYSCLAQGLSLGDAAREARISLRFSDPHSMLLDWGVPVLFTRIPDAVLCSRR